MSLLDRLEPKLGRFAVPNVILFIIILQSLAYVIVMAAQSRAGTDATFVNPVQRLLLVPSLVAQGEVWRLVTFLFIPPLANPLFAFFGLFFLYIMGTALEGYWGAYRFNVYLLIGWLATIAAACPNPTIPAANVFLEGSIFLAFAFLYPDYTIRIFFVIPVRVKWIAWFTWGVYGLIFLFGPWSSRFQIVAAVLNFLLFFGRPLYLRLRYGARKAGIKAKKAVLDEKPFHTCAACGITDKTHPKMEFRYCPDCAGTPGFCIDHINNHMHRAAPVPP